VDTGLTATPKNLKGPYSTSHQPQLESLKNPQLKASSQKTRKPKFSINGTLITFQKKQGLAIFSLIGKLPHLFVSISS
jgi:hypothetical protein